MRAVFLGLLKKHTHHYKRKISHDRAFYFEKHKYLSQSFVVTLSLSAFTQL